jgi:hypothetical protein
MIVIVTLLAVAAFGISLFCVGYLASSRMMFMKAKEILTSQTEEFNKILKAASEANNSHAQQMVTLGARIESLEFHKANSGAMTSNAWGKAK